jgi:hypothetical protein
MVQLSVNFTPEHGKFKLSLDGIELRPDISGFYTLPVDSNPVFEAIPNTGFVFKRVTGNQITEVKQNPFSWNVHIPSDAQYAFNLEFMNENEVK